MSAFQRVVQLAPAPGIQAFGQLFHRQTDQLGPGQLAAQDLLAGDAKQIGEGLAAAIGAVQQEQVHQVIVLLAGQRLGQMEASTGVETQGQPVILRLPRGGGATGAGAFGDVEGVGLIGLVIGGQALLEPAHLARVEQEQAQIAGVQLDIVGQLPEEGKPVVGGGFPGDIQAVEAIGVQAVQQSAGPLIAPLGWRRLGARAAAGRRERADRYPPAGD
jgi:hypothetical protein